MGSLCYYLLNYSFSDFSTIYVAIFATCVTFNFVCVSFVRAFISFLYGKAKRTTNVEAIMDGGITIAGHNVNFVSIGLSNKTIKDGRRSRRGFSRI